MTASPSGSKGTEAKESAKSNAESAKQEGKSFLGKTEDKAKVGFVVCLANYFIVRSSSVIECCVSTPP